MMRPLEYGYSNCKLISPDDVLMCRVSNRRAQWYLVRDLADVTEFGDDGQPQAIKLRFQPNGMGQASDPFYTEAKANRCVVCGKDEELTKHHCVPSSFRRYFPAEYKTHLSHDIVLLDIPCHKKYETLASIRKMEMVQVIKPTDIDYAKQMAHAAARTIIKYGHQIPAERLGLLRERIRNAFGDDSDDMVLTVATTDFRIVWQHQWRQYVETITDLEAFIRGWREHFVKTMEPRFLPDHWSVNGRYTAHK